MNTVLIIGYVWVEPNSSAAGSRMLQLITQFLQKGYNITFATQAQKSVNAFDLTSLGVTEASIELNSSSFDAFIKQLNPKIVVFDRFMIEEQFGWRVAEYCPNAIRVLDTEDLHSLRKIRQEQLKKGVAFQIEDLLTSDVAKREIASILRCDLSLIISSFEMDVLVKLFQIDTSLLLHIPFLLDSITPQNSTSWLSFGERANFVFVGTYVHAPNVDAVLQLKKIWKSIRKELPTTQLHIYGAYATQQIKQLNNSKEGFIVKGFAENIEKIVSEAKVVLAPIRFGAGIKGKLTEAMICGTPSVTTKIGAEGMHKNLPWNGFVVDDEVEFWKQAVNLYKNKEIWEKSQQNGIEIINQLYDKSILGERFIEKIEEVQENLDMHRKHNFFGSLLQHQTLNATKYMSKWIEAKNS